MFILAPFLANMPRKLLTLAQTCRKQDVLGTKPLVVLLPRNSPSHEITPVHTGGCSPSASPGSSVGYMVAASSYAGRHRRVGVGLSACTHLMILCVYDDDT
jgi:hypothetical protein